MIKRWARIASVGGLLIFPNLLWAEPSQSKAITLTWTADPTTTQTISWRTSAEITAGSVECQRVESTSAARPWAETQEGVMNVLPHIPGDQSPEVHLFTATVTGLTPGTQYRYTIVNGTSKSAAYTFSTYDPKSPRLKFLVFGDSQSKDGNIPEYTPWQTTLRNAYRENPDASFFVNVGDLVDRGQDYQHWNNWFTAAAGVIDKIPSLPVPGNHETYNPNPFYHDPEPIYFESQFKLFVNGPEELRGRVYSYDIGPAHIVVLDSQQEEEGRTLGDILTPQKEWLSRDLASCSKPWKLVFFHKALYSNKPFRSNDDLKQAFCPVFDQYHVDLVFNAHDHSLARTYPIKGGAVQKKPKEGTVYYITGRSGGKSYMDVSEKQWNAFYYNPQDQPCYLTVQADAKQILVVAKKQDGTVLDTFAIDK